MALFCALVIVPPSRMVMSTLDDDISTAPFGVPSPHFVGPFPQLSDVKFEIGADESQKAQLNDPRQLKAATFV